MNGKNVIEGIHHIGISVRDIKNSIKFYTEGLGAKLLAEWSGPDDSPVPGQRAAMLDIGNGNCLELIESGINAPPKNEKFPHLSLSTSDVSIAFENAVFAGAEPHLAPLKGILPLNTPTPFHVAFIMGPDGELIELFQSGITNIWP